MTFQVHTEHSRILCQNHTTGNYLMGGKQKQECCEDSTCNKTREQFLFRKYLPLDVTFLFVVEPVPVYSLIRKGIITQWFRLFSSHSTATKAQQLPKLKTPLQSTCRCLMLFFPIPQWWHDPFAQKRWHWAWIAQVRLTEVMTMDSTHLT